MLLTTFVNSTRRGEQVADGDVLWDRGLVHNPLFKYTMWTAVEEIRGDFAEGSDKAMVCSCIVDTDASLANGQLKQLRHGGWVAVQVDATGAMSIACFGPMHLPNPNTGR